MLYVVKSAKIKIKCNYIMLEFQLFLLYADVYGVTYTV
jgi:hypothetical protein